MAVLTSCNNVSIADFFYGGDYILRSCSRCGHIHDSKYLCKPKLDSMKSKTKAQAFRSSYAWLKKQQSIRERDFNLCRICLLNKYDTKTIYNTSNLSVHHIIPIRKDYEKRLDDDNLITLCRHHHDLAEVGKIPTSLLISEASHPPIIEVQKFQK